MIVRVTPHQSSDEVRAKSEENFEGRREKTGSSCDPRSSPPRRAVFHPTHTLWKGGVGNYDGLLCRPGREVHLWAQGGLWWPSEPHPMDCFQPMTECSSPWETWVSCGVISGLLVAIDDTKALSIAAQSSSRPIQHLFLLSFTGLDLHCNWWLLQILQFPLNFHCRLVSHHKKKKKKKKVSKYQSPLCIYIAQITEQYKHLDPT